MTQHAGRVCGCSLFRDASKCDTEPMDVADPRAARSVDAKPWTLRRVVTAGVIGNVLEWYDFAIYGFFAPILASLFFPTEDRTVSLIAAFGAFAVGFMMRPIGGAIFGHIGDRYGRARALLLSVAMMAIPTVAIGLLPTYETIGASAAILVVALRMLQGIAIGGEFTSSIVFLAEHSPSGRRAFYTSWAMFAATLGTLLGAAVGATLSNALSEEALVSWGWRLAFISGIAVGVVGIILRRGMLDSTDNARDVSPVYQAFADHGGAVAKVFGLNAASATTYYLLFVYAATWLVESGQVERAAALNITTLTILSFLLIAPIAAWASDRFGRRPMMLLGMSGSLLLAYPILSLTYQSSEIWIAGGLMLLSGLLAVYMASIPAAMCEMFPREVRVSAVSIGYSLAYAVFGGTAPAIAVWLISRTGSQVAFAWYMMAMIVVSATVATTFKDIGGRPLEQRR